MAEDSTWPDGTLRAAPDQKYNTNQFIFSSPMYAAEDANGTHADPMIVVRGLDKTYASGFRALKGIDLTVCRGEIFALLGPNGAGKTTLISIICGIVNPGHGSVTVDGHDIVREWRKTRSIIGLVPQELHTDAFETVWNTVRFSRGLFGKAPDDRQGAGAPADRVVPGRAHRRCRCGTAPRHVGDGAAAARVGGHHHPDHALHRGGRGHGRPGGRDPQGRADRGRGQDHADAQTRQETVAPATA